MCRDERIRALKQRIAEASKQVKFESEDDVTLMVMELQDLCPHLEKTVDEDDNTATCTCCWKVFNHRRA